MIIITESCYRYGNIVPRTHYGKIATMLYAVLGIPVYILYFRNMGKEIAIIVLIIQEISYLIITGVCQGAEVDLSQDLLLDCQEKK